MYSFLRTLVFLLYQLSEDSFVSIAALSARGEDSLLIDNRNILKAQPLFTNVITTTLRRCSLSSLMSQLLLSKGAISLHGLYQSSLRLSRANDTKKLMGPPLISGVPLTNTKTKLDLTKLFSRYHHDNYLVQI